MYICAHGFSNLLDEDPANHPDATCVYPSRHVIEGGNVELSILYTTLELLEYLELSWMNGMAVIQESNRENWAAIPMKCKYSTSPLGWPNPWFHWNWIDKS